MEDCIMQIVEALEALLGRRYSSMLIYPNESPIAAMLCKPFVKNDEVFDCDHITLSKNDDSFIVEIHTLSHYEKRSLSEYKDLVSRLGLFISVLAVFLILNLKTKKQKTVLFVS